MYREPVTFYSHEVLEYNRKSRSDDPLLSLEEVLEKHGKILEEYAERNLGGPIPEGNKYTEEKRLLSAVTVEKIGFLEESLPLLADDVYVIEDEWGSASEAVFVDAAAECQAVITANLQHTKLQDKARLMKTDVLSALDKLAAEGKSFDIIFMDPPYESGLYGPVLQKIIEKNLLKQEGYLITERSSQIPLETPAGMEVLREKAYKTTILTFLGLEETK